MAIHNCYLIGVLLCKQEALMEARMKIKIQKLPLPCTMGPIISEFVFQFRCNMISKKTFPCISLSIIFKNKSWALIVVRNKIDSSKYFNTL